MDRMIDCSIDGKRISAPEGTSILEAALSAGIEIPHLCHDPRLTPTGACRLCIVEIEGVKGYQPSCARNVEEGMIIRTGTENIRRLRKVFLELLISEHRLSCLSCDRDGSCALQDYGYEYGLEEGKYPLNVQPPPQEKPNFSTGDRAILFDPSKCIRCLRCVKICEEVMGVLALTVSERSEEARITTPYDLPLKESACVHCGQCVGTCPVGALYPAQAAGRGKQKDFNITRTTCIYCGVGCQLDLHFSRRGEGLIKVTSEAGTIPNDGNTCVKGRFGFDFIGKEERLTVPLIKENGAFREAGWDEALSLAAEKFLRIKGEYGGDALAGLSSAKATNEENYIMQKFVRAVFGTNNVDHCARLCHASTVAGLARAFGSGAMTNSIEELGRAPLVFVIGSNTTENHPVIGGLIHSAARGGKTKLIVADPRKIP